MSKFQLITLAVFVLCIIAGVTAFALYKGGAAANKLPTITIWGTFPAAQFDQYVATINNDLPEPLSIRYVQEGLASFSQDFIAALARGTGPDAILIPADMILPHEDKLALIPYTAVSQRTFIDTYIDEASIYISTNGLLAIPFTVDPLVMYWNRDMFNAAGIATYPRYWEEFTALNQKLTLKDQNGNLRKTAIALGDFSNIVNAREILGSLFLQIGNPVTQIGQNGLVSTIKVSANPNPSTVLQFFTQFVDPTNVNYSWNRSMSDSRTAFISGVSATYFGFASELAVIRAKNPNLNFDVAPLPQVRTGGIKANYGKLMGFSLVRSSPNTAAAFQIISTLLSPTYLGTLSASSYAPSVRRDLIAKGSTDPYISIFNQAALLSRTWLDSDPAQSRQIFGAMVESFTSGQSSLSRAIQDAGEQYDVFLKQAVQQ